MIKLEGQQVNITFSYGHYLENELSTDMLKPIFKNGKLLVDDSFSAIRERLANDN